MAAPGRTGDCQSPGCPHRGGFAALPSAVAVRHRSRGVTCGPDDGTGRTGSWLRISGCPQVSDDLRGPTGRGTSPAHRAGRPTLSNTARGVRDQQWDRAQPSSACRERGWSGPACRCCRRSPAGEPSRAPPRVRPRLPPRSARPAPRPDHRVMGGRRTAGGSAATVVAGIGRTSVRAVRGRCAGVGRRVGRSRARAGSPSRSSWNWWSARWWGSSARRRSSWAPVSRAGRLSCRGATAPASRHSVAPGAP